MIQDKLISMIIGGVLVLGMGSTVYLTKKPAYIPENNVIASVDGQTQNPVTVNINVPKYNSTDDDDDEDEDDDGIAVSPNNSTPTPTPTQPTGTTSGGITLAQIAGHKSRTSCWSAVNGSVYDLTSWIPNHPGGEQVVLSMCGIDGSSGYNAQHGGRSKPATILGGFKLGALTK